MPKFDLSQYATVEERLKLFWSDPNNADARIVTINHTTDPKLWVTESRLYLTAGDQATDLPKSTGWASEAASDAFALERCETSSLGRCLSNYIYSGSKRASREEMVKVSVMEWLELAQDITSLTQMRDLYLQAKSQNAPKEVLEQLKQRGDVLRQADLDI